MPTSKDDYLINTLRFVSVKEETQIYDAILPDSLTSPEMKETKAYKTYLGFATGVTLSKKARKVKRPAKKTTKAPERGVVIRETPEIPLSKKKEKVDVTQGKGIELLSQVALTEDAQFEEFQKKSMRDFHKTHPTGSRDVKIIPSVKSEGTCVKPGVPNVTKEESSESEVESWGNNEDDSNNEQDSSGEDIDQYIHHFIPQSFPSFTPLPQQSTSTPPPTTEAINPLSTLPDFTLVFQFNNRVTSLEKEVVELKKDPLHTQVTALVDDHY
ncbi:hypothetical protein Tco_0734656 [Tanacetum coccineum]